MRLSFKEMKDSIAKIVPKDIQYDVDLEAGDISIVTPTPDAFGGGDGLVGKLQRRLSDELFLRPESIMNDEAETEEFIRELIEDVAGIDSIYFDACYCEVTVICNNPGEAVGRRGANAKLLEMNADG